VQEFDFTKMHILCRIAHQNNARLLLLRASLCCGTSKGLSEVPDVEGRARIGAVAKITFVHRNRWLRSLSCSLISTYVIMYADKFIPDNVISRFLQLSVVIATLPSTCSW